MAFFLNDQSDTVLFRIFLGLLCKGIAGCNDPKNQCIVRIIVITLCINGQEISWKLPFGVNSIT